MSRVFAPYNPQRKDRATGLLVDIIDGRGRAKAERFGELVFIFTPNVRPFNSEGASQADPLLLEARRKLETFDPENDYVLLVGNPVIMALVATAAADASGGPVQFLQWTNGDYKTVDADFSVGLDLTYEGETA